MADQVDKKDGAGKDAGVKKYNLRKPLSKDIRRGIIKDKEQVALNALKARMRVRKMAVEDAPVDEREKKLKELEIEQRNREQAIRDGIEDMPSPWLHPFRRAIYRDEISDREIGNALSQTFGIIAHAARLLGVDSAWLRTRIDGSEVLKSVRDELREVLLDFAEGKLVQAVTAGIPWAIQYYLNAQGRGRGYAETDRAKADGGLIADTLDKIAANSVAKIADMRITPDDDGKNRRHQ